MSYNWFLILCTKFSHKSWDQNWGGLPHRELFFKISETVKVNYFKALTDLWDKNFGLFFLVNKYTYARYCTETDIFFKLPELDPDPDLVVKFPDPDPAKKVRIRNTVTIIDKRDRQNHYSPYTQSCRGRDSSANQYCNLPLTDKENISGLADGSSNCQISDKWIPLNI